MPSFYANTDQATRHIAIIVFNGTKLLDVAGPLQVFNDARLTNGTQAYTVDLLSETGGAITTDTVCKISSTSFEANISETYDTVLVSGGQKAYEAMKSNALLDFIERVSGSCRRLGSICLGAFILAAGGHLTGKKATTHWGGCAELNARFPDIIVNDDAIFVEDNGIWTSAGVTAGIDMAIEMVKQDIGAGEALRLAKSLVLPIHRSGGQRQFSVSLSTQISSLDTRISELIAFVSANLQQTHSVSEMSARVGMSERNFSRKFSLELGISPARFVEQLRVDHASALLHQGNVTLAAVQHDSGFSNAEQMRRAFHRCKGVSPSDYAAKFALYETEKMAGTK